MVSLVEGGGWRCVPLLERCGLEARLQVAHAVHPRSVRQPDRQTWDPSRWHPVGPNPARRFGLSIAFQCRHMLPFSSFQI